MEGTATSAMQARRFCSGGRACTTCASRMLHVMHACLAQCRTLQRMYSIRATLGPGGVNAVC